MENTQIDEESEGIDGPHQEISKKALIIETSIRKSKDGKWLMYKTITTDIRPIDYFEKVLKGEWIDEFWSHK